jgi:protein TonB
LILGKRLGLWLISLGAVAVAVCAATAKPDTDGPKGTPPASSESTVSDQQTIGKTASFEGNDYDWNAYAEEMVARIKHTWDVPLTARWGAKGRVTIRFVILRDGTIEPPQVLSSSSIPEFDSAARQAIVKASPFAPLPADFPRQSERVTVNFYYNLRPAESEPTSPRYMS